MLHQSSAFMVRSGARKRRDAAANSSSGGTYDECHNAQLLISSPVIAEAAARQWPWQRLPRQLVEAYYLAHKHGVVEMQIPAATLHKHMRSVQCITCREQMMTALNDMDLRRHVLPEPDADTPAALVNMRTNGDKALLTISAASLHQLVDWLRVIVRPETPVINNAALQAGSNPLFAARDMVWCLSHMHSDGLRGAGVVNEYAISLQHMLEKTDASRLRAKAACKSVHRALRRVQQQCADGSSESLQLEYRQRLQQAGDAVAEWLVHLTQMLLIISGALSAAFLPDDGNSTQPSHDACTLVERLWCVHEKALLELHKEAVATLHDEVIRMLSAAPVRAVVVAIELMLRRFGSALMSRFSEFTHISKSAQLACLDLLKQDSGCTAPLCTADIMEEQHPEVRIIMQWTHRWAPLLHRYSERLLMAAEDESSPQMQLLPPAQTAVFGKWCAGYAAVFQAGEDECSNFKAALADVNNQYKRLRMRLQLQLGDHGEDRPHLQQDQTHTLKLEESLARIDRLQLAANGAHQIRLTQLLQRRQWHVRELHVKLRCIADAKMHLLHERIVHDLSKEPVCRLLDTCEVMFCSWEGALLAESFTEQDRLADRALLLRVDIFKGGGGGEVKEMEAEDKLDTQLAQAVEE
ncbi:hypothetical protein JKP88DRAFT_304646 [Tribonema minus]|uniref:Uncharacterized protein n=1 Tax=Tribonema minus TaxID=303371 RepID=A0A836CKG2_9STRA|nr:hypothetical protein JKP88DRAFT_304646 [Tribonema minus]